MYKCQEWLKRFFLSSSRSIPEAIRDLISSVIEKSRKILNIFSFYTGLTGRTQVNQLAAFREKKFEGVFSAPGAFLPHVGQIIFL